MSAEQGLTEAPAEQQSADNFSGSGGGYELDESGQRVPQGMGLSKSSRRRRRKRKVKGDGPEGSDTVASAPEGSDQVIASVQASTGETAVSAPAPRRFERQNAQQNGAQANGAQANSTGQNVGAPGAGASQNAPGGTKRWKKKFRERRPGDSNGGGTQQQQGGFTQAAPQQSGFQGGGFSNQNSGGGFSNQNSGGGFSNHGGGFSGGGGGGFRGADTHQPGNNAFKRKNGGFSGGGGKQQSRGRTGFVGPMDHSYRPVNGNVFDSSSTIDFSGGGSRGRHTGDSQPIDYSQGRAIPIAPDAPTKIYFFIDDLFFTAKISETARKLGVKIAFIKNEKEQIAALTAGEEEDRPGLIVFDLNNANAKPLTLIPKLKTKLKKSTSIIGFLSTLQGELRAKAVEAGCDTVMPRAAFSQNLPNLLRRYGLEEAEEQTNFNQ